MVSACMSLLRIIHYLREQIGFYREQPTDNSHSDAAPAGAAGAKRPKGEVMRNGPRKRKMDTASDTSVGGDGQYSGRAHASKSPRLNDNDHQRPSNNPLQSLGDVTKQTSHVCTVHLQDWNRPGAKQPRTLAAETEFK